MQNENVFKCHCSPQSECISGFSETEEISRNDGNISSSGTKRNECTTNEGCYKAIKVRKGSNQKDLIMGCFKNKSNHFMMQCRIKELAGIEKKCCRGSDFCNRNLTLESEKLLNSSKFSRLAPIGTSQYQPFPIHIAFWITIPVGIILILACLIFLLWKTLAHKKKMGLKFLHESKYYQDASMINIKAPLFGGEVTFQNMLGKPHPHLLPHYHQRSHHHHHQLSNNGNSAGGCCNSGVIGSSNSNNTWVAIDAFVGSGLPGSKSSSGVAGNSNFTATTALTDSGQGFTLDKLEGEDDTCTSGSGRGLTQLVQRTIGRQITLLECIGNGKFGKVWKARFQGEMVAVKIFSSREESSWARETNIYTTILLRHDNILGYYASDLISQSGCTELWMVMQYHELGSLHEYLSQLPLVGSSGRGGGLTAYAALRMAHSAAAGLCHLHTHIMGLQGKPPIAHRDIKSRNILVKSNGTCCIADLGLAVFPDPSGSLMLLSENGDNLVVGTKRYMSPELLQLACGDLSLGCHDDPDSQQLDMAATQQQHLSLAAHMKVYGEGFIENLKAGDVYSFSLVLWEIMSRIDFDSHLESYQLPFEDVVPVDPSFSEMYNIVVKQNLRPPISEKLHTNLGSVARIMEECWHHRASIRHSMLRVKKSLFGVLTHISLVPQAPAPASQFVASSTIDQQQIHLSEEVASTVANASKGAEVPLLLSITAHHSDASVADR